MVVDLYFFFSRKQLKSEQEHGLPDTYCLASDGVTIIRYTECTSNHDAESNWDDAIPLCRGEILGTKDSFDPGDRLVIDDPDGTPENVAPCVVPASYTPYSYFHTRDLSTSGTFTAVKQLRIFSNTQGDKAPETFTFRYEE